MGDTRISWATKVWNPVTGCSRVSPGCDHCFAFALHDRRYAQNRKAASLEGCATAMEARRKDFKLPWPKQYDLPFSHLQLHPERLDAPLHWRKPQRIFVNSMSDLFHEQVPDSFIDLIFAVMALAQRHTFQILTKGPDRMLAYMTKPIPLRPKRDFPGAPPVSRASTIGWAAQGWAEDEGLTLDAKQPWVHEHPLPKHYQNIVGTSFIDDWMVWPLSNVHLGISAEDQQRLDERASILAQIPAAVRFLSAEPLLGPLNILLQCRCGHVHGFGRPCRTDDCSCARSRPVFDQVIIGAESGPHRRPMQMEWARSVIAQCQAADVACFVKQDGALRPGQQGRFTDAEWALKQFPKKMP